MPLTSRGHDGQSYRQCIPMLPNSPTVNLSDELEVR